MIDQNEKESLNRRLAEMAGLHWHDDWEEVTLKEVSPNSYYTGDICRGCGKRGYESNPDYFSRDLREAWASMGVWLELARKRPWWGRLRGEMGKMSGAAVITRLHPHRFMAWVAEWGARNWGTVSLSYRLERAGRIRRIVV